MAWDNYCGANTCAAFQQTGPSLIGLKCLKKGLQDDLTLQHHTFFENSSTKKRRHLPAWGGGCRTGWEGGFSVEKAIFIRLDDCDDGLPF